MGRWGYKLIFVLTICTTGGGLINDNAIVSIAIYFDSTITVALSQCHRCHHENDTCCIYRAT